MGINIDSARFLLAARQEGAVFTNCLTLGRQHCFLSDSELCILLKEFGIRRTNLFAKDTYPRYSEVFWELLGTRSLTTLDASDFEGANCIHDMNLPIPDSMRNVFDAVCDGGTLEHVYNLPVALHNCMKLLKPGGTFFSFAPANNYFGHGFYQFSPELYFRVFSTENGFRLNQMIAVCGKRWRTVQDPARIGARCTLSSLLPVSLFVRATKLHNVEEVRCQQSDYQTAWHHPASNPRTARFKRFLLESMPRLARLLELITVGPLNRNYSLRNRKCFLSGPRRAGTSPKKQGQPPKKLPRVPPSKRKGEVTLRYDAS